MKIFLAPVKWISQINAKSQIGNDITIDGGVCFSDEGYIMFGAKKTGTGTIIGTRVTFGKSHNDYRCPKIGYNVWIGSDCVIYGNISIGDGATLLPNTVLSKSIPPNVVMQGNPARLVLQNFDNSELRDHHNIDAVQHVKNKRQMGNV
jgi:serine acetyltransferase